MAPTLQSLLLAGGLLMLASGSAAAGQPGFELRIEPSGGADFAGTCEVHGPAGLEILEIAGPEPVSRTVAGTQIRCDIEQVSDSGAIVVEVRKTGSGNISRSSTSGRGSRVNFTIR